ncbi:MAG: LCP family protein [Oscillospiraceae bacterium]|nr:LCP family protein [Oscillospiraceae bacterium]
MSQPNEYEHTHSGEHSHSEHHSSGHSSSHRSSGEHSSSHRSSGEHSSSHHSSGEHSSSHRSRHTASEEKRDALIRKYQVIEQGDPTEKPTHRHHYHRHRSRRSRWKRVLIAAACIPLALIVVAASAFAVLHTLGRRQIQNEGTGVQTNPYAVTYDEGKTVVYNDITYALNENIVTVAAMGVDRESFGLQNDKIGTAGQADMILIVAMDLKSGNLTGILIPRDAMVDVDQYTVDGAYVGVDRMQVCLSYAYGDGRETSCQNVLTSVQRILYGIPVHLYGVMDLDGIHALNDAIGGVTVTALETFDEFVEGEPVTLLGAQAESYVRSRNTAELNSDALRRERQIQYLQAFVKKGIRAAIDDIGIVSRLYNAATEYGFTNVSLSKATYLATTLLTKGVSFDNFLSLQGELQDADPYPEYILDEQAVFETVLQVFYTPVG